MATGPQLTPGTFHMITVEFTLTLKKPTKRREGGKSQYGTLPALDAAFTPPKLLWTP